MVQGDDQPPGERLCPDCDGRWYSAALLGEPETEATCPDCGAVLEAESAA